MSGPECNNLGANSVGLLHALVERALTCRPTKPYPRGEAEHCCGRRNAARPHVGRTDYRVVTNASTARLRSDGMLKSNWSDRPVSVFKTSRARTQIHRSR